MHNAYATLLCITCLGFSAFAQSSATHLSNDAAAERSHSLRAEWPIETNADLFDLHQEPQSATDRSHDMFFDQGAWHGYALPNVSDTGTGFVGPFLAATGPGIWAGRRFALVQLTNAQTHQPIKLVACDQGGVALPGALARQACAVGLVVKETLFYAAASTTLVRVTLAVTQPLTIHMAFAGEQSLKTLPGGDSLRVKIPGSQVQPVATGDGTYSLALAQTLTLRPDTPATVYLQETYLPASDGARLKDWSGSPAAAWQQAGARWQVYLQRGGDLRPELKTDRAAQRINTKAMITLLDNWRAPLGDLHHDGLFPSYSNSGFSAFWAWDSWKHAAALAQFAPDIAMQQVRAMFDYQLPNGMIPDKVSRDRKENNLRDSKPPLAAWAVTAIYEKTQDRAFVAEMFDKLYRYHQWWYQDRDHDHNGLVEYGATDGTRQAAGWESGMDNAVRFDNATMVENHPGAWSLDQESVDLNCYLYREKLELAKMATLLGKPAVAEELRQEAAKLRAQIHEVFFDPSAGYFFDARLGSRAHVHVFGPEGWIPLLTGVATEEQAHAVAKVLMDPAKFNTVLPFPTLARDDPHFAPVDGYWRGPVWVDQAVFAVQGLERYGLTQEADAMRGKLLKNAGGLAAATDVFHETYDPLTGAGQNSRNFGWSAAEYFLLVHRLDSVSLQ